jgi:hypothetical protein
VREVIERPAAATRTDARLSTISLGPPTASSWGVRRVDHGDSKRIYRSIQDPIVAAARELGVPRAWFDDLWGDGTPENA